MLDDIHTKVDRLNTEVIEGVIANALPQAAVAAQVIPADEFQTLDADLPPLNPTPPGLYRHYKGRDYRVLVIGGRLAAVPDDRGVDVPVAGVEGAPSDETFPTPPYTTLITNESSVQPGSTSVRPRSTSFF